MGVNLSWECFQFSARLGACFARKAEKTAWQGAEVNSRLPDQGIESLRDVHSEMGMGLLRLCGEKDRRDYGRRVVSKSTQEKPTDEVTGSERQRTASKYRMDISHPCSTCNNREPEFGTIARHQASGSSSEQLDAHWNHTAATIIKSTRDQVPSKPCRASLDLRSSRRMKKQFNPAGYIEPSMPRPARHCKRQRS